VGRPFYVVEVGEHRLAVYQADLLRDFDGQVTRFRAWLDSLPARQAGDSL